MSAPAPGSFDRRNPRALLNLFAALSVLSVAVILVLVGFGVYRIYGSEVIKAAEHDAVVVAQAILEQERHVLVRRGPEGIDRIVVAREEFARLDERMRKYLRPFNMFKIKVIAGDKTIVYSTDPGIIGSVDANNATLDRVLRHGSLDSKLQSKDKVADLAGEERFNVEVVETYLPIRSGEAIIGSFEIYKDVSFARERIAAALASSGLVLLAVLVLVFGGLYIPMRWGTLWLAQAQDELRVLATIDSLTLIFNRRHLLERIGEEARRMSREAVDGSPASSAALLMVDIDHFKRINDRHGHVVGDAVLREVSATLRRQLRAYDVIGRYGGEEFLIMLPRTGLETARKIADRICASVRAAPVPAGRDQIPVTVSVGVAAAGRREEDVLDAIRRADGALYKAKNAGRDRVAWDA